MKTGREILKINELLLREVSLIVRTVLRNKNIIDYPFLITRVSTTKDYSFSFVYFRPVYMKDEKHLLKHLNHASSLIGCTIAPKLRMKRFPKIHFKVDKHLGVYNEDGALDEQSLMDLH